MVPGLGKGGVAAGSLETMVTLQEASALPAGGLTGWLWPGTGPRAFSIPQSHRAGLGVFHTLLVSQMKDVF